MSTPLPLQSVFTLECWLLTVLFAVSCLSEVSEDPAAIKSRPFSFPVACLAACVLGIALCPCVYIAFGALHGFSLAFKYGVVPALMLGDTFLLWRYLSSPRPKPTPRRIQLLEWLAWSATLGFLHVMSGVNATTGLERFGGACAVFLPVAGACLPIVLNRKTDLGRRLTRLPLGFAVSVLLAVLVVSGAAAYVYLLRAPTYA